MTSIKSFFVHVLVTDGRFFVAAGIDQLCQDLEGVDRHRPNLLQEVGGLHVRNLFNLIQQTKEQVKVVKSDDNKVMNIFFIKRFLFRLGFQIYLSNSLRSFI